jgi:hypothetical protein
MSRRDQHEVRALVRRSADDKENTRLIVSRIVLETLEGLEMTDPETSVEGRRELLSIRKRLAT